MFAHEVCRWGWSSTGFFGVQGNIILYGRSIGSGPSIHLATRTAVRAMVLQSHRTEEHCCCCCCCSYLFENVWSVCLFVCFFVWLPCVLTYPEKIPHWAIMYRVLFRHKPAEWKSLPYTHIRHRQNRRSEWVIAAWHGRQLRRIAVSRGITIL